ncbi:MAG: CRISPR-associated endonuclease Cas2 [Bacillota bacterium]|nr:CRISPR-associated endonuclease Cas2 [Bacillota bacterium]
MYVVCVYDVHERACVKVMKILRRYMFHVQNSVFEGTLTPKQFTELKEELKSSTNENDSVLFYVSYNEKQIYKEDLIKKSQKRIYCLIKKRDIIFIQK